VCVCVEVEKARHVLLLREKLTEQKRTLELSKLDKDALNKRRRQGHVTGELSAKERERSSSEMEKSTDAEELDMVDGLMMKCLKLMLHSRTQTRARLMAAVREIRSFISR